MSYRKNIHEILTHISIAPEFEKESVAKLYADNTPFKKFMSMVYDPRIAWDLPEGMPPHKRDETIPPDMAYTTLMMELKTMYVYFAPSPLKNKVRREARFIEMLESLHYKEADLIVAVKDAKFDYYYPGVTRPFMIKMFPDVFTFDGLFLSGEWLALDVTQVNGSNDIEFIKADTLESFVKPRVAARIVNYFTREVYKEYTPKEIKPSIDDTIKTDAVIPLATKKPGRKPKQQ